MQRQIEFGWIVVLTINSKSWLKIVGKNPIKELNLIACAAFSALQTSFHGGGDGEVGGELDFINFSA